MFDKRRNSIESARKGENVNETTVPALQDACFSRTEATPGADALADLPHSATHHRRHPFRAPPLVGAATAWFEGTFDPLTSSHLHLIKQVAELGFERMILGIVPQNPYKSGVTPLHHRVAMAEEALKALDFAIAPRLGEPGIYITRNSFEFNTERLKSWFFNDRFIVMGADNFERYYGRNDPWTTILPHNPVAKWLTAFQRLYPLFSERLLVSEVELPVHSSQVRGGETPLLPAITPYADRHGLYPNASRPPAPGSAEAVTEKITPIITGAYPHLIDTVKPHLISALRTLTPDERASVVAAAENVLTREQFEIRFTRGRSGDPLPVHRFQAPPFELTEASWCYRAPNPAIRPLRNATIDAVTAPKFEVQGKDAFVRLHRDGKRLILVLNHLDYNDLAVLPYALERAGEREIAEKITIFVGPKMFHEPWNSFMVLQSIGAIKIPQSPHIATEAAVMPLPETAQRAEAAYAIGRARLAAGDVLTIFPEGARQSSGMRAFGSGYLRAFSPERLDPAECPPSEVFILPAALDNVDHLFKPGYEKSPAFRPPSLTFGRPICLERLLCLTEGRATAVTGHLVGHVIAGLLPESRRGVYGEDGGRFVNSKDFRMNISEKDRAAIVDAARLVPQFYELAD